MSINNSAEQPLNTVSSQTLEFFATSIAALARSATSPKDVLEDALSCFDVDSDELLSNKAIEAGYHDYKKFQDDLLCLIGEQLQGLQSCHLTAAERAQMRLIQAL